MPPARTLLALLVLATAASAQSRFVDPDFQFSMEPPPGMVPIERDELARIHDAEPGAFDIVRRADTESGQVQNLYVWRDETGHNRQVKLLLHDMPPPFRSPEQVAQAMAGEPPIGMELDIDLQEPMNPPEFAMGFRVEGRRELDGAVVRVLVAYYPMSNERYGLLSMQCLEPDWEAYRPEFMEALRSVKYPPPQRPGGAAGRPATPLPPGVAAGPSHTESWESLEVTGSLVLAFLLLMRLFFGGRPAA